MSKKRLVTEPLEFEPLSVQSWAGLPYNILNHSKWRRIEKDLPKCLVIGVSTLTPLEPSIPEIRAVPLR
jgi:hypothetical protein